MAAFCDHRLEPSHDSVCAATDEARENDDKMTSIKKKKKKKKKKLWLSLSSVWDLMLLLQVLLYPPSLSSSCGVDDYLSLCLIGYLAIWLSSYDNLFFLNLLMIILTLQKNRIILMMYNAKYV